MLRGVDRTFLRSIVDYSSLARPAVAVAIKNAGVKADEFAANVLKKVCGFKEEEAIIETMQRGYGGKLQKSFVLKIFAEYFGGLEDLGTLASSIADRKKESIFVTYAERESIHGDIFRKFIDKKFPDTDSLIKYLKLPRYEKLTQCFSPEELEKVRYVYEKCHGYLSNAASMYFKEGEPKPFGEAKADVYLVSYIKTKKKEDPEKRRQLVYSYNKIKHRFLIVEDAETFATDFLMDCPEYDIYFQPFYANNSTIEKFIFDASEVSRCFVNLATLLLVLDQKGYDL